MGTKLAIEAEGVGKRFHRPLPWLRRLLRKPGAPVVEALRGRLANAPAFLRNGLQRQVDALIARMTEQLKRPGGGDLLPRIRDAVREADARGLAALRDRLIHHPLFRGTVIDGRGASTAVVVRLP